MRRSPIYRDRVLDAVESEEYVGFCGACGHEQSGVEPDASEVVCRACGLPEVLGAEWILEASDFDFDDDLEESEPDGFFAQESFGDANFLY